MTASAYLDLLDELLRPGIAGLSAPLVDAQVRFVAGCQRPDGGFGGRQGGSDPYYTDFALRVLTWLAPAHEAFSRTAAYLAGRSLPPRDVVECFSLLSTRRLLERQRVGQDKGTVPFSASPAETTDENWDSPQAVLPGQLGFRTLATLSAPALDPLRLTEWLYGRLLPSGGFARTADDPRVSAYHTFLGALCFQMLGVEMPAVEDAVRAVQALRRPDGGYAELAGQSASQTNATAAALGFLTMHDGMLAENMAPAARFFAQMQSADGGLKPHAAVRGGDLLSTFTGLLTLWGLDARQQIDAAAVARFLRGAAHPGGGFLACDADDAADVEYTYYGVGTLALLRLWSTAP